MNLEKIINSSPNVVYKYQPLFSYELKNFLNDQSSLTDIGAFFEKLETTNSDFLDQIEGIKKGIIPSFKKQAITHVAYKEVRYHNIIQNILEKDPGVKIIGLVRNPLSVINSWVHSPREFRKDLGWSEKEEWRLAEKKNQNKPEEFYGFEKWKEVANMFERFAEQYKNSFCLVKYDTLLKETENETERIFNFCKLELGSQTKEFLNHSRSASKADTYSVFNSKTDDSERALSLNSDIAEVMIKELAGTCLEKYL